MNDPATMQMLHYAHNPGGHGHPDSRRAAGQGHKVSTVQILHDHAKSGSEFITPVRDTDKTEGPDHVWMRYLTEEAKLAVQQRPTCNAADAAVEAGKFYGEPTSISAGRFTNPGHSAQPQGFAKGQPLQKTV